MGGRLKKFRAEFYKRYWESSGSTLGQFPMQSSSSSTTVQYLRILCHSKQRKLNTVSPHPGPWRTKKGQLISAHCAHFELVLEYAWPSLNYGKMQSRSSSFLVRWTAADPLQSPGNVATIMVVLSRPILTSLFPAGFLGLSKQEKEGGRGEAILF